VGCTVGAKPHPPPTINDGRVGATPCQLPPTIFNGVHIEFPPRCLRRLLLLVFFWGFLLYFLLFVFLLLVLFLVLFFRLYVGNDRIIL
tara:strand:+ start:505 stop:768 length:264 start_codon:yes stop_codon:yes gene_type:complete